MRHLLSNVALCFPVLFLMKASMRSTSFLPILCTCFSFALHQVTEAQVNKSPYQFTEIFRIGDESAGDTILFRSHLHSQISVNSNGQLFVGGGWRESPIMSFSDRGDFAGYLGAVGAGPGEFRNSTSVIIGLEDSIYVFDRELNRLVVFDPKTLQYVYSRTTVNAESNFSSPSELLGVTKKGYLYKFDTPYRPSGNEWGIEPDDPRTSVINFIDWQDVKVQHPMAELPATERLIKTQESSITVMLRPFGRSPFFVFKNGVLYAGWNDTINISIISDMGEQIQIIKAEHEAQSVTRKELESIVASNHMEENHQVILQSELIPETKPAYDAMVVDDHGHIWIRKYPDTGAELALWMIIGSDNKLVGEMELPSNLLLKTIQGGRAYASVESEIYGPYIVVYSISSK